MSYRDDQAAIEERYQALCDDPRLAQILARRYARGCAGKVACATGAGLAGAFLLHMVIGFRLENLLATLFIAGGFATWLSYRIGLHKGREWFDREASPQRLGQMVRESEIAALRWSLRGYLAFGIPVVTLGLGVLLLSLGLTLSLLSNASWQGAVAFTLQVPLWAITILNVGPLLLAAGSSSIAQRIAQSQATVPSLAWRSGAAALVASVAALGEPRLMPFSVIITWPLYHHLSKRIVRRLATSTSVERTAIFEELEGLEVACAEPREKPRRFKRAGLVPLALLSLLGSCTVYPIAKINWASKQVGRYCERLKVGAPATSGQLGRRAIAMGLRYYEIPSQLIDEKAPAGSQTTSAWAGWFLARSYCRVEIADARIRRKNIGWLD